MDAGDDRDRTPPTRRPPRFAEWLTTRVLPHAARDSVLGDLQERYVERVRLRGVDSARRWYARQVLGFLVRLPLARVRAAVARSTRGFFSTSGLAIDVRHATRAMIHERGLTAAVIVVLGLAVGASATVFSVINGVLLRPLPFAEPDALVMLWDEYGDGARDSGPMPATLLHYRAWRSRTDLFTSIGAFDSNSAVIHTGQWLERVDAALVSAGLLSTLGVQPALGRLFSEEDDVAGAPAVVILSHELWQTQFGGDTGVIDRSIDIDGEPTRIVGVMPRTFWFYDPYAGTRSYTSASASAARLWRPLAGRLQGELDYPRYRVIARLRPDVTAGAAAAAAAAAEHTLPPGVESADGRARLTRLDDQIAGAVRPRLVGLSLAVGLVLLIAAVNLASLLAARLDARHSEFAIRAALGATPGRVWRALMIHGTLLSLAGGIAGLGAALVAVPSLLDLVPRGLPLAHRVDVSAGVVVFGVAVSVAVGLAVSAFTAARLGPTLTTALGARSRNVTAAFASRPLRNVAVAAQVALSLVLLISATLLMRSLVTTYNTDAGFDGTDTLTFQTVLQPVGDAAPDFSLLDRLEAHVASLPGVASAGSATVLPFSRWVQRADVRVDPDGADAVARRIDYRLVSPGYFTTLRIGRLAGRAFTPADRRGRVAVGLVNRAFADRFLGGVTAAIGRRVIVTRGSRTEEARTIVGVVKNVKESRLFADDAPIVYAPIAQGPTFMRQFVVRADGDARALVEPIRRASAQLAPGQPLQDFITLDALVEQSLEEERFYAVVAACFATVAVLLALAGLYGAVSFAARQRDREVGVRVALGATPASVYRLVLGEGLRPVFVGLVLGCLGAAGVARLLRGLLHGVPPVDPFSYVTATVAFALVAALACVIPARRAATVDAVRILGASLG